MVEQRGNPIVAGALQARLRIGDLQAAGDARLVAPAGLGELALGQREPCFRHFGLLLGGMQAVQSHAYLQLDLLVQVVGSHPLLAELRGRF